MMTQRVSLYFLKRTIMSYLILKTFATNWKWDWECQVCTFPDGNPISEKLFESVIKQRVVVVPWCGNY